jgi:hypothetical protein
MQISTKLQRASQIMAWMSLTAAVGLALAVPVAYLLPDASVALGHGTGQIRVMADDITAAVPLSYRLWALLAALVPTGLTVWALVTLFRLFRFYAAGAVFEAAPLACLRRVASLLFWIVLAHAFATSAKTYILGLIAGKTAISFAFSTYELSYLFVAGVAVVITRVMGEACRIADENATFI